MRVSRACLLLVMLISGGMAACAAPEPAATSTPVPMATPVAQPVAATSASPVAQPTTDPTPVADPQPAGGAITGEWGGLHVLLTLTANGGRIEYTCAQGTLDAPVRPDARGVFHVRGQHTQNHGGPARVADEPPAPQQVTYDGTVSGDRMQLRVTSSGEEIGSYALRRGADPQMVNCL